MFNCKKWSAILPLCLPCVFLLENVVVFAKNIFMLVCNEFNFVTFKWTKCFELFSYTFIIVNMHINESAYNSIFKLSITFVMFLMHLLNQMSEDICTHVCLCLSWVYVCLHVHVCVCFPSLCVLCVILSQTEVPVLYRIRYDRVIFSLTWA